MRGQRCPGEPELVHTDRSWVCSSVLCTRPAEPLERYWGRSWIPLTFGSWLNALLLTDQLQEHAVGLDIGVEIIASNFELLEVKTKPMLARLE